MSNELVGLHFSILKGLTLVKLWKFREKLLECWIIDNNGHIKRGRTSEWTTQKQPPSDAFLQNLGGVPFAAGLELEGVGVDGGLGAGRQRIKPGRATVVLLVWQWTVHGNFMASWENRTSHVTSCTIKKWDSVKTQHPAPADQRSTQEQQHLLLSRHCLLGKIWLTQWIKYSHSSCLTVLHSVTPVFLFFFF